MRRWASTLRIWVSEKEVIACTRIEATTPISKSFSISMFLFAITSSTRYLLAHGRTSAESLLITMRMSPTNRSFFRGHMMVLKTFAMLMRGFFADASIYARTKRAGFYFDVTIVETQYCVSTMVTSDYDRHHAYSNSFCA